MTSCAALLFHNFLWEPCGLSMKGQTNTPSVQVASGVNPGADVGAQLGPRAYVQRLNRTIRRHLVARDRFNADHHDICMYIERSKNENIVVYRANLIDSKTGEPVESGAHQSDCSFKTSDPLHAYWIKINPEHVARRRARGELEDTCELNMIERKLAYGCKAVVISKDRFFSEVLPDKASRTAASKKKMEAIELLFEEVQPCVCNFAALSSWPVWMLRLPPLVEGKDTAASVALNTDSEASPSPHGGGAQLLTADGEAEEHALPTRNTVVAMVTMIAGKLSVLQKVYVKSIEPKHFYQLPKVEHIEVHGTSLATGESTYEKLTR
ncbi:conserved hypothetical protein [Leishmania infantum JPCM5]|uniref:DUF4833 domain-containing protein n=2 Tax=Leishmania infantum TaxID=5671 RepID=A4HZM6_LEIIN|nr:conserved hypothetical protein [Leishmania infantum JPCM5]CAC9485871.1 hypothetical_protein_-_conserved [Leishmania infantum]CAM67940.1 conserved hypothetical protein [Leishmania infantum JPCM5]SUZ41553.1 hypothetical_protein_-_conserved [Leishmania infantum]|eukprot:XP_001465517.1 conserved hypothetical protein [Leishmania infantum JPCM5]